MHFTEPADIIFSTQQDGYQSHVMVTWILTGNAMGFELSYQNASSTINVCISGCRRLFCIQPDIIRPKYCVKNTTVVSRVVYRTSRTVRTQVFCFADKIPVFMHKLDFCYYPCPKAASLSGQHPWVSKRSNREWLN